jgi:hypothetical protein
MAVAGAASLRNTLLGRLPPYSSQLFISRVAARGGWRLSPAQARLGGALFRVAYGTAFGLLFARLGGPLALRRPGIAGAGLGASVLLLEHLTMPPLGITPPARSWTRAERLLLIVQTTLFGHIVARAYRQQALSVAS